MSTLDAVKELQSLIAKTQNCSEIIQLQHQLFQQSMNHQQQLDDTIMEECIMAQEISNLEKELDEINQTISGQEKEIEQCNQIYQNHEQAKLSINKLVQMQSGSRDKIKVLNFNDQEVTYQYYNQEIQIDLKMNMENFQVISIIDNKSGQEYYNQGQVKSDLSLIWKQLYPFHSLFVFDLNSNFGLEQK